MIYKWVVALKISKDFQDKFPEIDSVVLQLLYNRNLRTQKEIDEFLLPDYSQDLYDPFLFRDMERAVERIFSAIKNQEKVVIYGDYDADGVTAATVLFNTLKYLGAQFLEVYLPDRELEGYGLKEAVVKQVAKRGVKLIITCDCGITNFKEAALAKSLGIDLIITDHHLLLDNLPEAFAIINPHGEEKYPFKYLAGVGVAFKVAQALLKQIRNQSTQKDLSARPSTKDLCFGSKFPEVEQVRYRAGKIQNSNPEAFEKWLLDLVAIGTITDSMSLLGENRTLVRYGLIVLNKTSRWGLRALIKATGLELGNLNARNIAYQLGPRLNAAGRLDHANTALALLTSEDKQTAERIAYELNDLNYKRQRKVEECVEQLKNKIGENPKERIIVECGKNWPLGIVGLVAAGIQEIYSRPAFIFTEKEREISGSGRSISEFNLVESLKYCEECLERFGGHAQAAGCCLKEKQLFNTFKEKLIRFAEEKLKDVEFKPKIFVEAELDLAKIDWSLIDEIEKFIPFGEGNPYPLFLSRNLVVENFSWVGQNGNHLRLLVNGGKKLIFFNGHEESKTVRLGDKIDIIFEPDTNIWDGNKEIQLKVIDLRII